MDRTLLVKFQCYVYFGYLVVLLKLSLREFGTLPTQW